MTTTQDLIREFQLGISLALHELDEGNISTAYDVLTQIEADMDDYLNEAYKSAYTQANDLKERHRQFIKSLKALESTSVDGVITNDSKGGE